MATSEFLVDFHWFDEEDREHTWSVYGLYTPGRPAPRCSDPDSPRFSDDGDPEEIEIHYAEEDGGRVPDGYMEKREAEIVVAVRENPPASDVREYERD